LVELQRRAALFDADERLYNDVIKRGGITWLPATSTVVDPSGRDSPEALRKIGVVDASIVFAPSSSIAPLAIAATKLGGTIVLGALTDLDEFPFVLEKRIVGSVIGSEQDMREVLGLAESGKLKALCESHKLEEVNDVLLKLKKGEIRARAMLVPK
jgi:propanol-preferring alcohol dehydrogenase